MRRLLFVLAALCLLAAACGGDTKPTLDEDVTLTESGEVVSVDEAAVQAAATAERAAAIDLTGPATVELADEATTTLDSGMTVSAGVTDDEIRIGTIAPDPDDVTAVSIHGATLAVLESINDNGGIGGRELKIVEMDNDGDLSAMAGDGDNGVALVAGSGSTDQTQAAIAAFAGVPVAVVTAAAWSGFSDPAIAPAVNSVRSSHCVEGMNGVEVLLNDRQRGSIAIVTSDSLDARDSAAGAVMSAEWLGIEIAFDGVGAIAADGSNAATISEQIVAAGPDMVWIAAAPATTAAIISAADGAGLRSDWGAPSWSWNPESMMVDGAERPFDRRFTLMSPAPVISTSTATTQAGAAALALLRDANPDLPLTAETLLGWVIGSTVQQALEAATAAGDLSRNSIADQLRAGELVFGDVTPRISWKIVNGVPTFSRSSYVVDVVAAQIGDATTISAEQPTLGLKAIKGPFNSQLSNTWEFATCSPRG